MDKLKREIKFRAWDKKEKKMVSNPITWNEDCEGCVEDKGINDGFVDWGNWELMQYTGLKDSKGKEIYEGDIVTYNITGWDEEINEEYNNQFKGIVEYYYDKFVIKFSESKLSKISHELGMARESKVIGNIYENPDLINPLHIKICVK